MVISYQLIIKLQFKDDFIILHTFPFFLVDVNLCALLVVCASFYSGFSTKNDFIPQACSGTNVADLYRYLRYFLPNPDKKDQSRF